ncbi:hypothetical protein [Ilumatobacter fluminis]|uniref:hypothetical protein n=1 Tax=Ilumatobacter fluminis TaxID=467091 RepID=UPI001414ED38|nr:hypothetical protein [Ilumatobacter fluminis]
MKVRNEFDDLVRALMRAAQARGRRLGLDVRFRRRGGGRLSEWELIADGPGVLIAAWAQQLERELPIVAEGFTGRGHGATAVRVARSLVARFVELCVGDTLSPYPSDVVVSSRDDEPRVFWPILDPPDRGHPLSDRLTLADEQIGRWIVGDLPDEIGLEEMHTALEIVLRSVLAAGNNTRFPALLDRARAADLIGDDGHEALTRLNAHRRAVKHHGGVVPIEDQGAVRTDLWRVADVLDRLQGRTD